jgi:hypothetical protein
MENSPPRTRPVYRSHAPNLSISTTSTLYTIHSASVSPTSAHTPSHPSLILDSTCSAYAQNATNLPEFTAALKKLPIPVTCIDLTPTTEGKIGGRLHESELKVGTRVRIASMTPLGVGNGELRASNVRESLRQSLVRLGSGRVEYLVAQRPDMDVSVGELTGGFGALVYEGLISKVCVSSWSRKIVFNRFSGEFDSTHYETCGIL